MKIHICFFYPIFCLFVSASEMTYIVSGAWGVKLDSLTHPCLFASFQLLSYCSHATASSTAVDDVTHRIFTANCL